MKIGSVVLYKQHVAVVSEMADGKILLQAEDKSVSDKRVREKDVILLTEGPVKNLSAVLQASVPDIDFSIAGDFFSEAKLDEIIELFYGKLKSEQIWNAWCAISRSPYFLCSVPTAAIRVRSQQEVDELQQREKEKENEAALYDSFIVAIKTFLKNNPAGKNTDLNGNAGLNGDDKKKYAKFFQELENVAYNKTTKSKILVDLKIKQSPDNAHALLLQSGYWSPEKNPFPQRLEVPINDSKSDIDAPQYTKPVTDLTHLITYAIDNADSTDPDDSVAFYDGVLYVNIACPAETITHGSAADEAAKNRGTTLYLPELIARMLNGKAIEYFALGLNSECHALTFAITFDENFDPRDVKIFRSKIIVKRLTYEDADVKKDAELKSLFELSDKLFSRRIKNGGVSIKLPEIFVTVKKENEQSIVQIEPLKQNASSEMIREIMLITGEAGAMFAFKNGIPFQYISQEKPSLPAKLAQGLAGEYQKRKAMRSRVVSTVPSKHFALGLSMYAQLTSPLRRYVDLISQQQILKFIDGEPLIDRETFLLHLSCADIAVRKANQASRLSKTHWILIYFLQHREETFEAVVLDAIGNKLHLIIAQLAFELDMNAKVSHELNDTILLKITDVDIPNNKVGFREV